LIVDWHAHVYPPEEEAAPLWQGRSPLNIARLLDAHERAGIDLCVVTNPIHYLRGRSDADCLTAIKRWNAYALELQEAHRDRIIVFSSTIPGGGTEFVREVESALDAGLAGVFINSSHHEHYPDEDEALPFFELVASRNVPVMLHAPAASFGEEHMRQYRLTSSIGRPADECLALARLIVRGVLARFPSLKLVAAHLGGGICEVIGRLNYAWELQEEAFFLGPYEPRLIDEPPLRYLKDVHLDTVSYHAPAVMCAVETVGVERIVFGSDSPPLTSLLPRARALVEGLPLGEEERALILGGNALRLLGKAAAAEARR